MSSTDSVRVSTRVAGSPEAAFDLFTREIDVWWKRGSRHRFRVGRDGRLAFEPGSHGWASGRLVEIYDDETGAAFEIGRVLAWEPPSGTGSGRLVFEWRTAAFADGETTEVEVRFTPEGEGTRVELEHRGWDGLAADHPVRHGLAGPAFANLMGLWWADLLVELQRRAWPVR